MNRSFQQLTKLSKGHKILLGTAFVFLLGSVSIQVMDVIAKNRLINYERYWEARGEDFTFADFAPKPVPDIQNFALTPVVASSYYFLFDETNHVIVSPNLIQPPRTNLVDLMYMNTFGPDWDSVETNLGDWEIGKKTDLKAWQTYYRSSHGKTNGFPIAFRPQDPAADVLLALSKYETNIEELRQAATLPDSRYPLNYSNDFPERIVLVHLGGLESACQVLELRAIAELQNKQNNEAMADVQLMFRLIQSVRTEPFSISCFARTRMLTFVLQPVWEGLQEQDWSDNHLKELDHDLAQFDFLSDCEFAARSERSQALVNLEYLRRTRDLDKWFVDDNSRKSPLLEEALRWAPQFVYYQNELTLMQWYQAWLPTVDAQRHSASPKIGQKAYSDENTQANHMKINNALAQQRLTTYLNPFYVRCCHAQSAIDMARISCALERYRLVEGTYPATLDVLSPRFTGVIPRDIIGGLPLKYHLTTDGNYVLYSVGWNETDDGGATFTSFNGISLHNYDTGDWVWNGPILTVTNHL
jgi:hypothetical protein